MPEPAHGAVKRLWRASATALLLLFAALLLAPGLLAARQGDDASLPACCRAHGKHHCAMGMRLAPKNTGRPALAQLVERCPCSPAAPVSQHRSASELMPLRRRRVEAATPVAPPRRTDARRPTPCNRSNSRRGPPAELRPA